jgi:hypothetical protein
MRKIITFEFLTAGTLNWTADEACILQAVSAAGTACVVSKNPSATTANVGSVQQVRDDILRYQTTGNASPAAQIGIPLQVPLSAGDKLYVNAGTAASVVLLYFDTISADLTAT